MLLARLDNRKSRALDKGTLTTETRADFDHATYALEELASDVLCVSCCVFVEQLATKPQLLLMLAQRQVVMKVTLQLLAKGEQSDFRALQTRGGRKKYVTAAQTSNSSGAAAAQGMEKILRVNCWNSRP
ncbi:hypothetical protein HPB48_015654 [Haemaphysalis longicornis]|uniref:Uncharacterized protein n=1 Tax=Haemaphysalis longicornis TaxID=44386 RepID=A0A9J6GKD1_HAELO|nr:hypothetical protein HPB48_015654 [Haemaphysalis longicornis]